MKDHKIFKCKDEIIFPRRILTFGKESFVWEYGIVSHDTGELIYLVGDKTLRKHDKILPYKNNEKLVGTIYNPYKTEEEVKFKEVTLEEGEWVMCSNSFDKVPSRWKLRSLRDIHWDTFKTGYEENGYNEDTTNYKFVVRLTDFNPSDMEDTFHKILYAEKGKIVSFHH